MTFVLGFIYVEFNDGIIRDGIYLTRAHIDRYFMPFLFHRPAPLPQEYTLYMNISCDNANIYFVRYSHMRNHDFLWSNELVHEIAIDLLFTRTIFMNEEV